MNWHVEWVHDQRLLNLLVLQETMHRAVKARSCHRGTFYLPLSLFHSLPLWRLSVSAQPHYPVVSVYSV